MSTRARGEANDALPPDFLDFLRCLNARRVDVVLVGGYALGVHGVVRATGDIDFLYRRTKLTVRRLCAAMEDFGAPPEVIEPDVLMKAEVVTQFGQPPYRIDLLSEIDGVSFGEVWRGALRTVIDGQPMRVIGVSELLKNKKATGRRKDAEDARQLGILSARKSR